MTGNASTSCDLGNGGCKQLCFDLLTGRKCGCTDTMKVSADGVSCEPSRKFHYCPIPILQKWYYVLGERNGSGVELRTLDYENPGSNPVLQS